mgnify:CR=1 FL=1
MLLQLKQLLQPEEIAQARQLLGDDAPWLDGRVSAGSQARTRKSNQQLAQADTVDDAMVGAAEQMRQLIRRGEYPVGQRLPAERDLAVQFGVSRPSVREALIALEVEGLGTIEEREEYEPHLACVNIVFAGVDYARI